MINLLTNAIKYSPVDGAIEVVISYANGMIRMTVSDQGIGIAKSRQKLIFEKFSRGHDASQKFSGLGLGLFISSQIIRRHKGDIGVNSEAGQGASFWFELPLNV